MFKYILALAALAIPAAAFADTALPPTPNATYAELAATANDVLKTALEKAASAGDFLEEQVPLVVEELIAWKIVSNFMAGFFFSALAIAMVTAGYKNMKKWEKQYDNAGPEIIFGLSLCASTLVLVLGATNVHYAVQWWIAPRVALLEYAASLAR